MIVFGPSVKPGALYFRYALLSEVIFAPALMLNSNHDELCRRQSLSDRRRERCPTAIPRALSRNLQAAAAPGARFFTVSNGLGILAICLVV